MTTRRARAFIKIAFLTIVSAVFLVWIFLAYLSPDHVVDWLVMSSFCT